MKRLLLIISICLLLLNCESKPVEKPEDLISKDKMVDILYDLYVVNAIKSSNAKYLNELHITPANYIYQKYKVDSLQFSRSDRYYATDVDDYEKLYQRVTTRLQERKAAIDTLISKNPEETVKKNDTLVAPFKTRDSLSKKRALKKGLFKANDGN